MTANLKISDAVVESTVGDAIVLMHLGSGDCYTLQGSAAEIWRHIGNRTPMEAIPEQMGTAFDAPAKDIEADLQAFLGALFAAGILLPM